MLALAGVQGTETGGEIMPLTKAFNETIREYLQKDTEFRRAYLKEAVGCMIAGDVETGKSVLRKYINGTIGFVKLGEKLGRSPKTLMRMFSAKGNPQAKNLFEIVAYLQKVEGTKLEVVDRTA
jgi:DNA-binding phage protein